MLLPPPPLLLLLLLMLLPLVIGMLTVLLRASSALYCTPWAQRSISRARITGSGWLSARVCALRRYHPSMLLVVTSSYDRACGDRLKQQIETASWSQRSL